jgi:hypothetical protein
MCIILSKGIERGIKEMNNVETKRNKFIRIAEARTNKAAEMIKLLGNCANKSTYDYTDDDIRKIFSYLEKEIKNARNKFSGMDSDESKFSLK